MRKPFECYLCVRAGRESGKRQPGQKSRICQDCAERLAASGRAWCPTDLHVVARREIGHNGRCHACDALRRRMDRGLPPDGYIRVSDVAQRLRMPLRTLEDWIAAGWMAGHTWQRTPRGARYIEDRAEYPPRPRRAA